MACVSEGGHVTPVTMPSLSFKHFKNYYLLFLAALDLHCGAWALRHVGLVAAAVWAYLPLGLWGILGPGIKPISPALADGFLTTGSLGKSCHSTSCSKDAYL